MKGITKLSTELGHPVGRLVADLPLDSGKNYSVVLRVTEDQRDRLSAFMKANSIGKYDEAIERLLDFFDLMEQNFEQADGLVAATGAAS